MAGHGGAESWGDVLQTGSEGICRLCWLGLYSLEAESPEPVFKQESERIRFLFFFSPIWSASWHGRRLLSLFPTCFISAKFSRDDSEHKER